MHGRQLKGELSMQCMTLHSRNQPGSQPQWVSATAEQFFKATWEPVRDRGSGRWGEQKLSGPETPREVRQSPWRMEMEIYQRQNHPKRERSMEFTVDQKLRNMCRDRKVTRTNRGESNLGQGGWVQGTGPSHTVRS